MPAQPPATSQPPVTSHQPPTPTTVVEPVPYNAADPRVEAMTQTLETITRKHGDGGASFVNLFNGYFQQILSGLKKS